MSGVTSEFSSSAYSAQDAAMSSAMQLQAALAIGALPAGHVAHALYAGNDTSSPEQLPAIPTLLSLRV
jgi:hypothetical protein